MRFSPFPLQKYKSQPRHRRSVYNGVLMVGPPVETSQRACLGRPCTRVHSNSTRASGPRWLIAMSYVRLATAHHEAGGRGDVRPSSYTLCYSQLQPNRCMAAYSCLGLSSSPLCHCRPRAFCSHNFSHRLSRICF